MLLIKSLILLLALHFALPAMAIADVEGGMSLEQMVKRINDRYDDFFRYHRQMEERWEIRRRSLGERKKLEAAHAARMERARQEYIKARRERPSDEPLRLRWEAQEKERLAHLEMLRRRYVQQRDLAEQYLKKGRQIPGMKEFDLEGY